MGSHAVKTLRFRIVLALAHVGFFRYNGMHSKRWFRRPAARVRYSSGAHSNPMAIGDAIGHRAMHGGEIVPISDAQAKRRRELQA